MAMAKQCDRCGSFYKDNTCLSIGGIFVTQIRFGSSRGDIKAYDFCDDCLSNFADNFMKEFIKKEALQSNTKRETISIRHRLGEYEGFKPLDEYGKCRKCKHLRYEDDYMQVYCDSEECDKCQ